MNIQEYMDEIVLPTVSEFKSNPRSRRHAYLATIVTFHLKDYLSKCGEAGIEDTLRANCGDNFDIVRGICNGTKHVYTNQSHPIPFAAGDDWDRPPAVAGQMICGLSKLGDITGGREIKGLTSGGADIYGAVKDVLNAFCKCYAQELGNSDLSVL